MNLQSSPSEILASICFASGSLECSETHIKKNHKAIKNFMSLRSTSKAINRTMLQELCLNVFIRALGAHSFFRNELPKQLKSWNPFIIQSSHLLTNWLENTPSYKNEYVPNGRYQPYGKNESAEFICYDPESKALRLLKIGASEKTPSTTDSLLNLAEPLQAPGKDCFPFCAHHGNLWAINEGSNSVSIYNQQNGKLLHKLENLGPIKQIEMQGTFLFILREEDSESHLLRYDIGTLLFADTPIAPPEKLVLSTSNTHIKHFYLSENRISFLESSLLAMRIWSITLSPSGNFSSEQPHEWMTSKSILYTNHVIPVGDDFILCEDVSLKLQRLKITDEGFNCETIVDTIPLTNPAKEIAQLFYLEDKLFIFYICKATSHFYMVQFDLQASTYGVPIELSAVKLKNVNFFPCATSSVGKVHLAFQRRQAIVENELQDHTAIATFDYSG